MILEIRPNLLGESEPFLRVIFTLNSCDPIEGVYICSYSSEGELLEAWQNFIHAVDPDVLTGFNILNFDLWFIIERAQKLTTFKVDLGRSKGMKGLRSAPKFIDMIVFILRIIDESCQLHLSF